jgi:hypothetical protein
MFDSGRMEMISAAAAEEEEEEEEDAAAAAAAKTSSCSSEFKLSCRLRLQKIEKKV